MEVYNKIEFFITPDGKVMINEAGKTEAKEFTVSDTDLCSHLLSIIKSQFPESLNALNNLYRESARNKPYYNFLRVNRFIRCNFGKLDGLKYDVDGFVLHLEDVACPIRCECPFNEIICRPKHPFGLGEQEAKVAMLISTGHDYKEISKQLGLSHSTIKNVLQKCKKKLSLKSSKDISKVVTSLL